MTEQLMVQPNETDDSLLRPIHAATPEALAPAENGSFFEPSEFQEIPRIITADCSDPKEIDDGLLIEELDENQELYRVNVCVANTSRLHTNPEVVKQVYDRTAARYWDLPGGERGYDPMIDPSTIKSLELIAGTVRNALIVSFLVGPKLPPSDVNVAFGEVEIAENKTYKEFSAYASTDEGNKYSRASQLIRDHLAYVAYGDHVGQQPVWREVTGNVSARAWKRGSKLNESFMVAANHLVGKLLADEGRPAIYRVHDPEDEQFLDFLSASAARYSRTPGPHAGLQLDPYCRVTSPLRRLDDFVMNRQLWLRHIGKQPTVLDAKDVAFAIRRLNRKIVEVAPVESARYSRQDILGRTAARRVVSLPESATAETMPA